MLFGLPLLSLIIWLPIAAGIAVLATGGDRNAQLARWVALIGSVAGFLVAIPLYTQFDSLTNAMQFGEHGSWIERFNIHYHLGMDGIAMPLILLNCFTTPLVVIAGWEVISNRVSQYMGAFLIAPFNPVSKQQTIGHMGFNFAFSRRFIFSAIAIVGATFGVHIGNESKPMTVG